MFVVVVDDDERCVCGAGGGGKKGEPLQKPLKTSGGIYTVSFPTLCSLAAGINPGILAWVPLTLVLGVFVCQVLFTNLFHLLTHGRVKAEWRMMPQ